MNGYESAVPMTIFGVIPVYGLLAVLSFVIACIWSYIEWNKKGGRTWDFIHVVGITTIFALYGAKVWYMVFDPVNAFAGVNDFLDILIIVFIPATGRSIIGTIVFAPLGVYIVSRFNPNVKYRESIDILLPAILIGQFMSRWGNFANHSVYGAIVDKDSISWLPTWIVDNMYIKDGAVTAYRQPLFLYESMYDAFLFILIFVVFKTNNYWKAGTAGASYIGLYGLGRASFELFRDNQFIMKWGEFPTSFFASILMAITGFVLIIWWQWLKKEYN